VHLVEDLAPPGVDLLPLVLWEQVRLLLENLLLVAKGVLEELDVPGLEFRVVMSVSDEGS